MGSGPAPVHPPPGGPIVAPLISVTGAGRARRADDLTQTLYRLREAAPGADERARVDDVLASLHALRLRPRPGICHRPAA